MKSKKKYNYSFNFYLDSSKIRSPKKVEQLLQISKHKYNTIGNLYSYNDASIGKNPICLKNFNKVIDFKPSKRIIEVQSGILLKDLLATTLKKNLLFRSMPGSKYVTLGGMIANNTQGKVIKNSFFSHHIISLKLIKNGKIISCSRTKNPKIFHSTIGGKGTTGIILSSKLKLDRIYSKNITLNKIFFKNIDDLKKKFLEIKNHDYVVSWLDNISKSNNGIIFYASHEKNNLITKPIRKEVSLPRLLIITLKLFSKYKFFTYFFNLIFKLNNFIRKKIVYNIYDFFFIQDSIKNWNEIFKNEGFFQYQFIIDMNNLNNIINNLKHTFSKNNIFSNFMVIKFFKKKNKIYNSISLDIPKRYNFLHTVDVLNNFSKKNNLLISLSKDSISSNINKKTLNSNKFLIYGMIDKNFESFFLKRIQRK